MKAIKLFLVIFFGLVMAACGGGGGTTTSATGGSTSALTGTAAKGAAIAAATVTIKGANGLIKTGTTASDGSYNIDVSGLTAPYLIKVQSGATVLYSIGEQTGTANVHPLTDLIIRTWYDVQNVPIDTAFANPVASPPPSANELGVIASVIKKLVQKWIVAAGLNTVTFNMFTTPFTANSSGFDGLLDTLTVASGVIKVDLPATSGVDQTTNLVVSASGIAADTTIIASGVTSTSFTSAYIPTTSAEGAALTGVLTTLSNMATTINTRGMSLAAFDLLPYFDASFLSRGRSRNQEATGFASDMAGATLNSFTIDHVLAFNAANNTISISGKASQTQNGVTVEQVVDEDGSGLIFKKQTNGSWLFYGNQERARPQVSYISENRMTGQTCMSGCDGTYYALQVQLGAVSGVVSSATITGPINGSTQTLPLTKSGNSSINGGVVEEQFDLVDSNQWWYQVPPANFAPAGSTYTFTVNFTDGSPSQTYTRILGASTSETFGLKTAGVGHSFSAIQDTPVTLSWNLPTSFPIASVEMRGWVKNSQSGMGCDINGPNLAATATTGTITLPSNCSNGPVIGSTSGFPSINIVVRGVNGETTDIQYGFTQP